MYLRILHAPISLVETLNSDNQVSNSTCSARLLHVRVDRGTRVDLSLHADHGMRVDDGLPV